MKYFVCGLLLLCTSCGYFSRYREQHMGTDLVSATKYYPYIFEHKALYDSLFTTLSNNCDSLFLLNKESQRTYNGANHSKLTAMFLYYDSLRNHIAPVKMPGSINRKVLDWCRQIQRPYLPTIQFDSDGSVIMSFSGSNYQGFRIEHVLFKSKDYKRKPQEHFFAKDSLFAPNLRYQISVFDIHDDQNKSPK